MPPKKIALEKNAPEQPANPFILSGLDDDTTPITHCAACGRPLGKRGIVSFARWSGPRARLFDLVHSRKKCREATKPHPLAREAIENFAKLLRKPTAKNKWKRTETHGNPGPGDETWPKSALSVKHGNGRNRLAR